MVGHIGKVTVHVLLDGSFHSVGYCTFTRLSTHCDYSFCQLHNTPEPVNEACLLDWPFSSMLRNCQMPSTFHVSNYLVYQRILLALSNGEVWTGIVSTDTHFLSLQLMFFYCLQGHQQL